MNHILGWVCICFLVPGGVLPVLSRLVLPRPHGERHRPVQASAWANLLLGVGWLIVGLSLLGHPVPPWLRWLLLPAAVAALALPLAPGIASRRNAGLPWWRFWAAVPSTADSGAREGSQETVIVPDAKTLIERIRTATFSTVRLKPGYDEESVDKFLDRLVADLGDDGRLDPAAVRDVKFPQTRLRPGYVEEDVDAFLDKVIARAAG
jgi:DivIVA domain-containing protein